MSSEKLTVIMALTRFTKGKIKTRLRRLLSYFFLINNHRLTFGMLYLKCGVEGDKI